MREPGGRRPAQAKTLSIRMATPADLDTLCDLEQQAFSSDRISRRSWQGLLRSPSAKVSIAMHRDGVVGATVLLHRTQTAVARLYSIAVSPRARQQGAAQQLLDNVMEQARGVGASQLRLETRVDNTVAQALFSRNGFTLLGRKSAYYADGMDALHLQRPLWNERKAPDHVALHAPYYAQTLDFTCGPCALLMAMAALDPTTTIDRTAEIRLWREATTIFMAAGHGGCGPFGLALAAVHRGFTVRVYAPTGIRLFVDSVRDPLKKAVIALVEADFKAELAATQTEIVATTLTPLRLAEHLRSGEVPIVLTSLWRLHGEKGPHWVVVTGFDGAVFRILDPIAPPSKGDPGISVSVEEFRRITRYGRRRQTAALILSKGIP
jgi:ribosomal protein S18 acetylase RimI-like enzyme